MNRLLPSLFFLVLSAVVPAVACMNDYKPNTTAIERSHSVLEQLQKHVVKEPWEARRDRLRKELAISGSYQMKNDLATTLAHTGQVAEAVSLLEQVEAEKHGLYMTAANLGTAYELAGDEKKALEWIRRGIERNAEAHEGTEWLHVRILEAKLAMKDDPGWLETNSISAVRKAGDHIEASGVGNRGEKLSVDQVKAALIYQLHERLQFVGPPDAIVGALLLELGDLLRREPSGIGGSLSVFNLASEYLEGLPRVDSLRLSAEAQAIDASHWQRSPNTQSYSSLILPAIAIVLIAFLALGLKRRIERKWS